MPRSPRIRILAALIPALILVMLASAPGANAAAFGELGHIGGVGTGNGQFTLSPTETDAMGVDPTNNTVYVVDDPTTTGKLRIQKFSSNAKGELKFVASAFFKPAGSTPSEAAITEGVAVDPVMHRVYVLALTERNKEPFDEVANQLWSFSTEQVGETLQPAAGTTAGVVADTPVFKAEGKINETLVEPSGITVEPIDATHDTVVLAGVLDTGEQDSKKNEIFHSQIWRISSEGKLLTEKTYVDKTDALTAEARSPVVFNKQLYVQGEEGIYEIPTSGPPRSLTRSTKERETWWEELELWLTPPISEPFEGGGMSVSPEGTFWTSASIKLAANKGQAFTGAVAYDKTGEVLGWTGGQSKALSEKCALQVNGLALISAGKEWTAGAGPVLFALDDNVSTPRLIEFGPGGEGCPTASAASPTAAVGKVPVEESQPIPIAATVEFDSHITQGNALSAEWEFGDGTAPVKVTTPAQQEALVSHKFAKGGTFEVKARIHTDDLASPTVEATSKVTISAEPPPPPTAVTGAAAPVSPTAEIVKGAVNPHGSNTTCLFEYGETTSYGKTASCKTQPGSGGEAAVEAEITGLHETTTYHYRLVAENAEKAKGTGADRNFTTSATVAPPPTVKTEPATAIGPTTATLNAKVDPEGSEVTECALEYGTTEAYGSSVPCTPPPGSGSSPVSVSGAATALTPSTTYHFRVRAKNSNAKTEFGSDATFKTTEPPAPKVKTEPATAVGATGATLNAKVDPEGSEVTECTLEYGTTNAYGSSVPCSPPPGAGNSDVAVSGAVSGLTPSTTYHFRVHAKNANATPALGTDATFKTSEPPAPKVTTEPASAITASSATLHALVDPEGSEVTECTLEYGTTITYGSSVPCSPTPGSGTVNVAVSGAITGLTANTTYHFRVRAKNTNPAAALGSDATFKTTEEGVATPPKVKTGAATAIEQTGATLNATVNPEGTAVTECELEYGTVEGTYPNSVACASLPGSGTSDVAVSGAVTGLTPDTTYHFRVRAKNSNPTAVTGADASFKTASEAEPAAPNVETEPASAIEKTAAILNATVNPEGSEVTECKLEYGTSTAYGESVPCSPAPGSGTAAVPVSGSVTGLTSNTTYHFRVKAKNANASPAFGADETFKTASEGEVLAPQVKTEAPGTIGPTAATLKAVVNAEGSTTECRFEYGPTTAYGSTATCMPTPGGSSPAPVSANVPLAADTTYHYRVWAKNANATPATGVDVTFKTPPATVKGSEGGGEEPVPGGPPASTTSSPPPGGGVKGQQETSPNATIAGSGATVSSSGSFTLKVSCPTGAGACTGSVVVKTAGAVAARVPGSLAAVVSAAVHEIGASVAATARKSVMTLSSASFSVKGGQSKPISLHLTPKARKLLAKLHVLRVKVTITARNPSGISHTSVSTLVLRAKKRH